MNRVVAAVAVLVALAVGAGLLALRDSGSIPAGAARLVATGRVYVSDDGGPLRQVKGQREIGPGDRVQVADGGAVLTAADGFELEMRTGSELRFDASPELITGDLLVVAGRRNLVVQAARSEVSVSGAAKVVRSLALSAAAYRGEAVLSTAGRTFTVNALRQASVPAIGVLPTAASPIRYDDADVWDRRFLGAAIQVGNELQARSTGFDPNVAPGQGQTAGFFRLLLPALDRETAFDGLLRNLLDNSPRRSPGETLVGTAIVTTSSRGSFEERWNQVFQFRGDGAHWGLVALDQGVADVPTLLGTVDAAIARAPLRFLAASATTGGAGSRPGASSGSAPAGGSPSTTQPPRPTTTTQPPDDGEGSGTVPEPPAPVAPVLEPVVDSINGLLETTPTTIAGAAGALIPDLGRTSP